MSALLAARALVHEYQYGDINAAAAFYIEAAEAILSYRPAKRARYQGHAAWYIERAETLHTGSRTIPPRHEGHRRHDTDIDITTPTTANTTTTTPTTTTTTNTTTTTTPAMWQGVFEAMPPYLLPYHARICLRSALADDEHRHLSDAIAFYSTAAAAYHSLANSTGHSPEARQRAEHRVRELVERAETLRMLERRSQEQDDEMDGNGNGELCGPRNDRPNNNDERSHKERLSHEEKEVLRAASRVEGDRLFMPWLDAFDLPEAFPAHTRHAFTDPEGPPRLSQEQEDAGVVWERPSAVLGRGSVSMVRLISALTIRQTVVTDCSFIASLCVAANYERRQGRALVSRCIYPQNAAGTPVYNPAGKYLVKLYFNGIARKVVVDDRIPVDPHGCIAASHTVSPGELWVTILEKAYMKVRGSYDGFRSTSTADLHALTGWIPVSVPTAAAAADPDRTWRMLHRAFRSAACIATANMGNAHNDSTAQGLAPHHSYAVLDVREVFGLRLLQLKNPWMQGRWCGPFSHQDRARWTPELQKELNYSIWRALEEDAGVFWIDYESVLTYMTELCLSFDPASVCGDGHLPRTVPGVTRYGRSDDNTGRTTSGGNSGDSESGSENGNIRQIHTRGWWWLHPSAQEEDVPPLSIVSDRRTIVCNPQFLIEVSTVDPLSSHMHNGSKPTGQEKSKPCNEKISPAKNDHNHRAQNDNGKGGTDSGEDDDDDDDEEAQQREAWILLTIHRTAATSLSLPYTALLVYPLTHKGSGPPKMYRRRHIPATPLLPATYANSSHILVRVPLSRGTRHRFVCVVSQEGAVLRPVSMTLSLYCPAGYTARHPPPSLTPLPACRVLTSRTITLRPQSPSPVLGVCYLDQRNRSSIDPEHRQEKEEEEEEEDGTRNNSMAPKEGTPRRHLVTEVAAEVVETGVHGHGVKIRVCVGMKRRNGGGDGDGDRDGEDRWSTKEVKGKWRRRYAVVGKSLPGEMLWIKVEGKGISVSTAVRVIVWTQENELCSNGQAITLTENSSSSDIKP